MKKMRSATLASAVSAAVLAGSNGVAAAVSESEFDELKAQFAAMAQRMGALEAENQQLKARATSLPIENLDEVLADVETLKTQNKSTGWAEKVSWKGDFRYRYEAIDIEDEDTRRRHRIRARGAMKAKLPNNTEVGLGLATGGDDPVSTNQTLGGGGSTKDIRLDLAYFRWNAGNNAYLQAGKYSIPFYRPQKSALIFDGDFRPEGFGTGWAGDVFFANFSGTWLESDSSRSNESFSWGVQGGGKFELGPTRLTAAIAYHDFPTKGELPFFDNDFFGNSSVGIGPGGDTRVYEFDYQVVELAADLTFDVAERPLSLYVDLIQNQDPDDYNNGYIVGAKFGKASGKGTWQLQYQYQDLEADATLGLLSDSDFAGGGTDGKGHRLGGAYGINKQWNVAFTWYINNEAGDKNLADLGGALDYDRIMIDTVFKY